MVAHLPHPCIPPLPTINLKSWYPGTYSQDSWCLDHACVGWHSHLQGCHRTSGLSFTQDCPAQPTGTGVPFLPTMHLVLQPSQPSTLTPPIALTFARTCVLGILQPVSSHSLSGLPLTPRLTLFPAVSPWTLPLGSLSLLQDKAFCTSEVTGRSCQK